MAKLKAPLLSLGASGSIAKTLTFFNWKGINVVREWVSPANPNTALQQVQRGYLTTLVDAVHASQARATFPLVQVDQVAYSALASTLARVMTWFNMACKLGIDALRLSDGYCVYSNGMLVDADKDDFRPRVYFTDNGVLQVADGKFFLGTTPTSLIQSETAVINPAVHAELNALNGFSGLTAGSKYYWQFRPDAADPCEGSDSGIYYGYAT